MGQKYTSCIGSKAERWIEFYKLSPGDIKVLRRDSALLLDIMLQIMWLVSEIHAASDERNPPGLKKASLTLNSPWFQH